MQKTKSVTPFLRWAGGKRWLAKNLSPYLKKILNTSNGIYYEPFLGAGAMFFSTVPRQFCISDLNNDLIETYLSVRDSWNKVESVMKKWEISKDNYNKIKSYKPRNKINKAARFIWLNRLCFGGLYRVNKHNKFNVPYGGGDRNPNILYKNKTLKKVSHILRTSENSKLTMEVVTADFENVILKAGKGDVIYCDPTYSNVNRGQFDRYGSIVFDWNDQIRLSQASLLAYERGATVLISNGKFPELLELYPSAYRIALSKKKTIGNTSQNPMNHTEYLFILDPQKRTELWRAYSKTVNSKMSQGEYQNTQIK